MPRKKTGKCSPKINIRTKRKLGKLAKREKLECFQFRKIGNFLKISQYNKRLVKIIPVVRKHRIDFRKQDFPRVQKN